LSGESQSFAAAISGQEQILIDSADPRIDEGIEFFRDRFESLRVKSIDSQTRTGETNLYTEKKEVFVYSNAAAIKNALAYCRAAIDELERMKLTPDLEGGTGRGATKGIPDENELTEARGEKPLPGGKGINPLHFPEVRQSA